WLVPPPPSFSRWRIVSASRVLPGFGTEPAPNAPPPIEPGCRGVGVLRSYAPGIIDGTAAPPGINGAPPRSLAACPGADSKQSQPLFSRVLVAYHECKETLPGSLFPKAQRRQLLSPRTKTICPTGLRPLPQLRDR